MFTVNEDKTITMHRGDTGAYFVRARKMNSGNPWYPDDRMIFTVRDASGAVVLQRFYRLDDDDGLGNGKVCIQFHNNDTDQLANGQYTTERRYVISARWNGEAPTGMCVDALTAGVRIVDGVTVRVPKLGQSTLTIGDIYGEV